MFSSQHNYLLFTRFFPHQGIKSDGILLINPFISNAFVSSFRKNFVSMKLPGNNHSLPTTTVQAICESQTTGIITCPDIILSGTCPDFLGGNLSRFFFCGGLVSSKKYLRAKQKKRWHHNPLQTHCNNWPKAISTYKTNTKRG